MSSRFAALVVWLVGTVGLALHGAASGSDVFQTYSDKQILDYYEQLAFGADLTTPNLKDFVSTHIWKRDQAHKVQVVLLPQASVSLVDSSLVEVKVVLGEIAQRSGGIVAHVVNLKELGLLMQSEKGKMALSADVMWVFIGNRQEMMTNLKRMSSNPAVAALLGSRVMEDESHPFCLASNHTTRMPPSEIEISMVWIETGPAFRECLYEEFMQAFGIAHDFPEGVPSIFSEDRLHTAPSELDWVLWRIHTDPSIVTGMGVDGARVAASTILSLLRGSAGPATTP
ncbi:DUF2927 domain-containing protein [Devosia sp.]|uniref:DUF2927 domain-containing protein n=1 Tax=Devosia sp. TaxID=1871048 RepID=UPI0035B12631